MKEASTERLSRYSMGYLDLAKSFISSLIQL